MKQERIFSTIYNMYYTNWFDNEYNLHRENGPAREYDDGYVSWFLKNKKYSFNEWCELTNKTDEEKFFLKLKYYNG